MKELAVSQFQICRNLVALVFTLRRQDTTIAPFRSIEKSILIGFKNNESHRIQTEVRYFWTFRQIFSDRWSRRTGALETRLGRVSRKYMKLAKV